MIERINVLALDWLTSAEALAVLGTQPQTLYANVSRGRIRAKKDPDDPRRSLYSGDDVRRLADRSPGRRKAESVAATEASLLVAANPGCTLQIATALRRRGREMAVAHPAQVLDASLRGLGPGALGVSS